MNESDVRQVDSNSFVHILRNNDNRIYLGTSLANSNLKTSPSTTFLKIYKLLQLVQQDSGNHISLLKSVVSKEFMTYQWKMALPRIVFNPLCIIFEAQAPASLSDQILCKPLVTGIINEIFKIIKKMDCKLVKGSENESNLFKGWCKCYPVTSKDKGYLNSPSLFYEYYKQFELSIDLLLLQPILLADDYGVRTPYLENLYSTMCQLIKFNSENSDSIFFTRKTQNSGISNAKMNQANGDYEMKMNQLNIISHDVTKLESDKSRLDSYLKEKEILKSQIDNDLHKQELSLRKLNISVDHKQQKLAQIELNLEQLQKLEGDNEPQKQLPSPVQFTPEQSREVNGSQIPKSQSRQVIRDSVNGNDNLEDLTDIALYGASLSGEERVHAETNGNIQLVKGDLPRHLHDKELELQKREQALINRELSVSTDNQSNYFYDQHAQLPQQPPYFQQQHQSPQKQQQSPQKQQQSPQQQPHHHQNPHQRQPPNLQVDTLQKQNVGFPPNGNQQPYYNQRQVNNPNGYYQPSPIDQQPPHGLPSNGLPSNGLPSNLRVNSMNSNLNRYNMSSQAMSMNGNLNYGHSQKPQRLSSFPNSMPAYNEQYQQQQQQQYMPHPYPSQQQQQQYYNPMYQGGAPGDPMLEPRFKPHSKRPNRRSVMPQMNNDLTGLDMGGRGGMPMSATPTSKPYKHKSSIPLNSMNGTRASPPQQRKSVSGYAIQSQQQQQPQPHQSHPEPQQLSQPNQGIAQPPVQPHSQQQYLQLPNGSNASSNSSNSVKTNDTPRTNEESNGIQIQVPMMENNAKPLGGITNSNKDRVVDDKKKKGLFGRK